MKKELSYLKIAIPFVNLVIFLQTLTLAAATLLTGFVILGKVDTFVNKLIGLVERIGGSVTLTDGGVEVNVAEVLSSLPAWAMVLGTIELVFGLLVVVCIRKFLKNIQAGEIFVPDNVGIAKRAALYILLSSFLTVDWLPGSGFSINGVSFTYLLAALLVWTISKVLEQANAIAEENDFTI